MPLLKRSPNAFNLARMTSAWCHEWDSILWRKQRSGWAGYQLNTNFREIGKELDKRLPKMRGCVLRDVSRVVAGRSKSRSLKRLGEKQTNKPQVEVSKSHSVLTSLVAIQGNQNEEGPYDSPMVLPGVSSGHSAVTSCWVR